MDECGVLPPEVTKELAEPKSSDRALLRSPAAGGGVKAIDCLTPTEGGGASDGVFSTVVEPGDWIDAFESLQPDDAGVERVETLS
mmetsp:Transcript_22638/g.43245  ORF Transcript_22638/g.43245 Transcript_22638/m.43245 type:complete len:85 (+) Transcript_22638:383-637(+)